MKTCFYPMFAAVLMCCFACSEDDGSTPTQDTGTNSDVDGLGADAGGEPEPERCVYPEYSGALRLNEIMPPLNWSDAYIDDDEMIDINLYQFYCEMDEYDSMIIHVLAGWCSACASYIPMVHEMIPELEANGALVIFLETQTTSYALATNQYAHETISRLVGPTGGARVGDRDTLPDPGIFNNSPDITAYPDAFVIRRSDMQIIATQGDSDTYLDLEDITANIEDGWDGGGPSIEPNCSEEDEEEFEPNNSVETAGVVGAQTVEGGICDFEPDFYQINIEGEWQLDLTFSHSTGDLDVYVWDTATNQPLSSGGQRVGSDSSTDNESFSYSGVNYVMILGYQRQTAPYTLTITEL